MAVRKVNIAGQSVELNIEAARGQYRIKNGQARRYAADYGEIVGSKGADGDPIDAYVGLFDDAAQAFVVNQYHADGSFDEHKVMLHFYDRKQAADAYEISTGTKPEIHACTPAQLAWWLEHGNHKKPVSQHSFPFDAEQEMSIDSWTDDVGSSAAKLLYGWRKTDTGEELLEAATMDALLQSELDGGAQMDEAAFDALVIPNKKSERTAQLLGVAFNRASGSLKVAEDGIHISRPMKQNGTTNIVMMFEMTDGQTVSVFLHNPDTTPQKISPDDMLISWKWLLNRKDITIAVAKENGRDLPLQQVARRVMALVEKNTARFAKANATRAERIANLQKMEAEIAEKEALLADLTAQIEAKRAGQPETDQEVRKEFVAYASDVILALEKLYDWNGAYYSYRSSAGDAVAYARLNINTHEKNLELQTSWEKSILKKGDERETKRFDFDADKLPELQAYEIQTYFIRLMVQNGYPLARDKMPVEPESIADEASHTNSLNTEPLNEASLKPLDVPEDATAKEVRKALEGYLQQLQGKTVITSDGKTVRFSRKSTKHIANDATVKKMILPQAVVHVVDVLKTGEFVGREPAYKERSDFVAFHAYRKWIELPDKEVLMQVKAAELPSGELEAGDGLLAYSAKDVGDKTKEADDTASFVTDGAFGTSGNPSINPSVASSTTGTSAVPRESNHNAAYDSAQDEAYIFIEILEVRDKQKDTSASGGETVGELEQADAEMLADWLMERGYEKQAERVFRKRFADRAVFVTAAKVRAGIMVSTDLSGTPMQQDFHDKLVELPSTGQKESFITYQNFAAIKRLVEEAETVAVDVSTGESAEYSADNPYAAYAGDNEEARRNADDWEAREPLTEAVLAQLNEKAEQQGFTTLVETRHASLGRFQAVKESGQMQVLIDGEFKNHGSSSVYEAARDFTVTLKDSGEVMDYFYTNDIDAALQKAGGWLDKVGNLKNAANPAPPDDARAYLQAVIDGKTDVLAEGFDDEFLAFVEQHEQDESLRELLEQAVSVWQQAALQASEDIK